MCIGQTFILGIPGAYLSALSTIDSDACIKFNVGGIIGYIYTVLGIILAATAGEPGHSRFTTNNDGRWFGLF